MGESLVPFGGSQEVGAPADRRNPKAEDTAQKCPVSDLADTCRCPGVDRTPVPPQTPLSLRYFTLMFFIIIPLICFLELQEL